ncbi:hypothetical protein ACFO6R_05865 [Eubacterium multiforme]|uniref:Uncharacterized protein n=1 Tax=Eubacterium multiforme TaxID=83339 RepID=A0ABT9US24_9FIRM|nr:hypothetical protein [Eubacterium multiforme]MDQ0149109.1 hypothetical protein [Eubacterium multiforme]
MKKYLNPILLLIVFLSIILVSSIMISKFPYDHPKLEVSSPKDNINFEASTNGGNWFDSYGGNSFDLGTYDIVRLNEIETIQVSCNTNIKLNLSFTKNIKTFKVYSINKTIKENDKHTEVEVSNYTFTTPKKTGVYGYIVETVWDDSHNVRFILKLKCK